MPTKSNLKKETKTCPKCAKRNKLDAKNCESCGFSFDKKDYAIIYYFFISLILVSVLSFLVYIKNPFIINNFSLIIRVLGGLIIFIVLLKTLFYGRKNIINLDYQKNPTLDIKGFKKFSLATFCLGIFIFIILLVYLFATLV